MTKIVIEKSKAGEYKGFTCKGHAGYASKGSDIVCASVSVLVINAINSMEKLAKENMSVDADEKAGMIRCKLNGPLSERGKLLMDSMILGLSEIASQYGRRYLAIKFKEV
ncbi:MAG: ribosomal-processing cysteine protease Prp [Kineothrix sp.]|nr:ribosomal-processing cysteine protease Prp [Kineothrix sp.]NBI90392.1 ribosomal-processing cysteine protease Prp [Lachnospiraceae bacterium]